MIRCYLTLDGVEEGHSSKRAALEAARAHLGSPKRLYRSEVYTQALGDGDWSVVWLYARASERNRGDAGAPSLRYYR